MDNQIVVPELTHIQVRAVLDAWFTVSVDGRDLGHEDRMRNAIKEALKQLENKDG